jgi:hypothetical protein
MWWMSSSHPVTVANVSALLDPRFQTIKATAPEFTESILDMESVFEFELSGAISLRRSCGECLHPVYGESSDFKKPTKLNKYSLVYRYPKRSKELPVPGLRQHVLQGMPTKKEPTLPRKLQKKDKQESRHKTQQRIASHPQKKHESKQCFSNNKSASSGEGSYIVQTRCSLLHTAPTGHSARWVLRS